MHQCTDGKLQVSCQSELFVKKNGMIVKIKHNLLVINNLILETKNEVIHKRKEKTSFGK